MDNASVVGTAISSVQVKVDGTVVGTATYGSSRHDVCAVYPGRPCCPNVGYSFSLDTSTLSVGAQASRFESKTSHLHVQLNQKGLTEFVL